MSYTYDRTARFQGSPEKLLTQMKESVDSLLETRVKIRRIHEALSELANDASGIGFTDVYDNPDVRKVSKQLYELDHTIGEAFSAVERLAATLKKKVK